MASPLPLDYAERVYAGVLGKIIGVYLGRPFEQWSAKAIQDRLGIIKYYVHEKLGQPLIVTDDDISGTFAFVRALRDNGNDPNITPEQIGETWLNTIIENRSILWWGGVGMSTEHTAFKRLQAGIKAPASGSSALNGQTVAEQIGSQIFIDGWGLICPGEPDRAADFARRAGSVSHDGVAIHGAQAVAAMVAQSFVESDINKVMETAYALIPSDSMLMTAVNDVRGWHAKGLDWQDGFALLDEKYGYAKFGGGCHMIPNHALIAHALLHGKGHFQTSQMVVNTCGLDTDCNAANVGCILGVLGGLEGLEDGPDFRGPVADRLLIPTAEGGAAVSDAVREADFLVQIAKSWRGDSSPSPKNGARFHFTYPGSVQGFESDATPETSGIVTFANEEGNLIARVRHLASGRLARIQTSTFITPEYAKMGGYGLIASPTLYPGQTVRAKLRWLGTQGVTARLMVQHYDAKDELSVLRGPDVQVGVVGEELSWTIPDTGGYPICFVGVELTSDRRSDGHLEVDWLTWHGAPNTSFTRTADGGTMWHRAWVNAADEFTTWTGRFTVIQNSRTGMISTGSREWQDYAVEAKITRGLNQSCGLAARYQGLKRYYALLVRGGEALLVKQLATESVLARLPFDAPYDAEYQFRLEVNGDQITGQIDGHTLSAKDAALDNGGIALVVTEGKMSTQEVRVTN